MKKNILYIGIIHIFLSGCANTSYVSRHAAATSIDSEIIAYSVTGDGETTLVFVHGWNCDGRYWQSQIPFFSKDYQVITIDLAGHGHSSITRQDFTMLSFAFDVKAVIEKENVNTAILIGHSMGGAVIAETARLMPEIISGIVGVDTLHNISEETPQNQIDEMLKPFEANFREAVQYFVSDMFPADSDPKLVEWVVKDMSSAPMEVSLSAFRNYMGQYVNGEAASVFNEISLPVVSINARLWPTSFETNQKHIKNYRLLYIEDTGHFPMLESPEEFNRLLVNALEFIRTSALR